MKKGLILQIRKTTPKRKKQKIIGLMKVELGRKIVKQIAGLRAKTLR